MSDFQIKPATRTGFKPLIGLYAESGNGKTYSALMLARGFVGPSGNITMIDTEGGRGGLYADVIPGGYNILDLEAPFKPSRLVDAIEVVEQSKADILAIDSASHFWEGIGGVLEWATNNEEAGKKGRQVWKDPKMDHERMVMKLGQTRLPIIVCLRAKHLLIESIDPETRRKVMAKDPNATPKQAEDFIYAMTFHAEIKPDHSLRITKVSHPTLRACFPENSPITIATGEKLAAWCNSPHKLAPVPKATASAADAELTAAKKTLWDMTDHIHKGNPKGLNQWLIDERFIEDTEQLGTLSVSRIKSVIDKIKIKLNPQPASEPIKELIP